MNRLPVPSSVVHKQDGSWACYLPKALKFVSRGVLFTNAGYSNAEYAGVLRGQVTMLNLSPFWWKNIRDYYTGHVCFAPLIVAVWVNALR